jgi:hypothetical protein
MLAELTAVLEADLPAQDDAAKLSGTLYDRCYTHSILDEKLERQAEAPAPPKPDLTEALAAANQGRTAWVEGWRIDQTLDDGRIVARKNGAARSFLPGQYITSRGMGSGPEEALEITVFVTPGAADIQPAFYYAFGETVSEYEPGESLLRVYWNIQAEGAPRLMETLTRAFNRFQIPFRFKCLNHASHFPRRDAAVLYIHSRYYPIAAMLVERVHGEVLPWLNESTPLFTKPLSRGLALAEDPGDSFGKHRCAILAGAMAASCGRAVEDRLAEVRRQFEERGLSLDAPWLNSISLNANSPGRYEYPFDPAHCQTA